MAHVLGRRARRLRLFARAALWLAAAGSAHAQDTTIAAPERWNAFGQATAIWNFKPAFPAAYTNLNGSANSLSPNRERSNTYTATAFLGARLWGGGELYLAPEVVSETPFSGLHGLGASIQNAELQKNGERRPTLYRSRLFLRQSWGLGGEQRAVESAPLQLAGPVDSRRLVITAGNLSILDIFDRNSYVNDPRRQFINMAFLTHAAYDFGADARGYSWGLAAEWYHDDWAVRAGRFLTPAQPNQLPLNDAITKRYGDQIEIEHAHVLAGQPGKLRLLAYRNVVDGGSFADAIAALRADPAQNAANCTSFNYGSTNASAPDLCFVRRRNVKIGVGLALEQQLSERVGLFARAMRSDGRTEVYSYTSSDSSASAGLLVDGAAWGRARDSAGIAYARSWLSASHVAYLAAGGIDGFIGDGALRYAPESVVELFYSLALARQLWVSADYQQIRNPAYNADRGPVTVYGLRLHAEF